MDGSRFDALARSLSTAPSRRGALRVLAGSTLGLLGWQDGDEALAVDAKKCKKIEDKKKRKKCLKKAKDATNSPSGGNADVCASCPDACFVNDSRSGYGCCPPDKVCPGANGLPDQCCDADEVCQPSLAFNVDGGGTVCCRTCANAFTNTGCCPPGFVCNAANTCDSLTTARLPRKRRP